MFAQVFLCRKYFSTVLDGALKHRAFSKCISNCGVWFHLQHCPDRTPEPSQRLHILAQIFVTFDMYDNTLVLLREVIAAWVGTRFHIPGFVNDL
jgi:hypothetical protein